MPMMNPLTVLSQCVILLFCYTYVECFTVIDGYLRELDIVSKAVCGVPETEIRETCKLSEVNIPKEYPGGHFNGSYSNAYLVHVKNDSENKYEIIIINGGKVLERFNFSLKQLDIDFSLAANHQVRIRDGLYTYTGPFIILTFAGKQQVDTFRSQHEQFMAARFQ